MATDHERFDAKWQSEPMSGCWLWTASVDKDGYGRFREHVGRLLNAHRVAYERWRGLIPEGLQIDHLCRTPACINPDHLEVVTSRVNTLRGESPSAKAARKTHCPKGHPYDEANTYVQNLRGGRRGRVCRACSRAHSKARSAGGGR